MAGTDVWAGQGQWSLTVRAAPCGAGPPGHQLTTEVRLLTEPDDRWRQREFVVETGLRATIAGLLAIYSDPVTQRHRYADGDEVQFVGVVFEGTTDGLITREPDDEIASVAFFAPARLPLRMFGPDRPVVEDALGGDRRPSFGSACTGQAPGM